MNIPSDNFEFPISLGVAMIVREAAETIERAIKSVNKISSQIVIVDTGSIDETPIICSRLGADVHFFKWNGNFSDARNYSLKLLKTDWILSLDADEELDSETIPGHGDIFNDINVGGVNLLIENILDGESGMKSRHRFTRLFRNHPQIRFEGSVHEQIAPSIAALGLEIVEIDIIIRHYGYNKINRDKIDRNKELIIQELVNSPDDPWLKYHLAECEFSGSNFSEASILFQAIADSELLSLPQKEMIRLRLAQIALSGDDPDKAIKWADFISDDIDREGLRQFIICSSYLINKNFTKIAPILDEYAIRKSSLVNQAMVEKIRNILSELLMK